MLFSLILTFMLFVGLACTLAVRLSGTLLILIIAVCYGLITGFATFTPAITTSLLLLFLLAEVGGRLLRIFLTKNLALSCEFSINSMVCHFGGIIACNTLAGPVIGFLLWEIIAGKTLLPHTDTALQVLLRLCAVGVLRCFCGVSMIIILYLYILRF